LAERYYGSSFFGLHLRQHNRSTALEPGGTVLLPVRRRVKVRRNQSLRDFAKTHMNAPERADYLKRLNNLSSDSVKQGDLLYVSTSLVHHVRPKETLSSIARMYYKDASPRRVELIQLYNSLSAASALNPNQIVRIPLDTSTFSARRVARRAAAPWPPKESEPKPVAAAVAAVKPSPPDATPRRARRTRTSKRRSRQMKDAEALVQAERALNEGNFTTALRIAGETIKGGAAVPVQVEMLRIAAISLVAKDRRREAMRAFGALLNLDADYKLDPYTTSPKVLEVFESVRKANRK